VADLKKGSGLWRYSASSGTAQYTRVPCPSGARGEVMMQLPPSWSARLRIFARPLVR